MLSFSTRSSNLAQMRLDNVRPDLGHADHGDADPRHQHQLVVLFTGILFILPLMRRVRADQAGPRKQESAGGVEGLPAAASD